MVPGRGHEGDDSQDVSHNKRVTAVSSPGTPVRDIVVALTETVKVPGAHEILSF